MVIRLYQYKLPLTAQKWREGLILQCGESFGEIAPLPGWSRETLEEARAEMLHWIHTREVPAFPSVRWGIECARKVLQPVHLPLCALGPKEGFSTVKLKLGHLPLNEAISLVKQHIGQFRLRLDCNRSWNLAQAFAFARHFQPTDFEYLEEPVQTFEELVHFSQATHFPIAIDESIHCPWAEIPSLKAVVVKPTLLGGIPEIPHHLDLILSSSYESGLGLLHIANRAKNQLPVGLDTYQALQEDLLSTSIDCSSGFFSWTPSLRDRPQTLNLSKLTQIGGSE